uniref:CSON005208 protein n=1 Tax=Culicoides sonorensis TaxID=179676 RepID=A0A336MQD2_CULSO
MSSYGCKCKNMLKRCQDTKFFEAIYNSDVERVKEFLEKETNINVQNADGYTAFHAGCCQQNAEIMDLLLENGYMKVDTKIKTRVGDSALFLVLTGYCDKTSANIVRKLVAYDPDLVEMADARGFTPLQAASRQIFIFLWF